MKIKGSLSDIQKQLDDYKKDIMVKIERYTLALADHGISIAENNSGKMGKYILFSKKTEPMKDGCKVIIYAMDKQKKVSMWKVKNGIRSEVVSPLLMAEFGSGLKAQNPNGIEGVGQGTFPNQTHAFDSDGWYWLGMDDKWHHSTGFAPSMPMYKASQQLINDVEKLATQFFG